MAFRDEGPQWPYGRIWESEKKMWFNLKNEIYELIRIFVSTKYLWKNCEMFHCSRSFHRE